MALVREPGGPRSRMSSRRGSATWSGHASPVRPIRPGRGSRSASPVGATRRAARRRPASPAHGPTTPLSPATSIASRTVRPRWSPTAVRWLWGGLALAVGLFIAGGGALSWTVAGATMLVGLIGVARGSRGALTTLWVGVGLCAGLCLHVTLELIAPGPAGLIPFGG